jgi:hypothetical protein
MRIVLAFLSLQQQMTVTQHQQKDSGQTQDMKCPHQGLEEALVLDACELVQFPVHLIPAAAVVMALLYHIQLWTPAIQTFQHLNNGFLSREPCQGIYKIQHSRDHLHHQGNEVGL